MELIIIAALSENNVIGVDGKLPWYIPEDLKRFKRLTKGYPIIMGRKTHESIGKPLKRRLNVVLTRQSDYQSEGVLIHSSLENALNDEQVLSSDKAYIIGGQTVYEKALPLADRLELTRIHKIIDGDTYFPEIDFKNWNEKIRIEMDDYSFISYVRNK